MRILSVTNLYPNRLQPNRATFNRQQFDAVAARCPMRVIAPIAWTDELAARRSGRWPRGGESRDAELRVLNALPEVEHPRYVFPPKVFRSWYGRFFFRSIRASFHRAVQEFRPNVILASWAYPDGWASVRLAREVGLPVIVKVHGSDVLLLGRSGARRCLTADALRLADGVITVSRDLASTVIELGIDPAKVQLIYNGVDSKLFSPGSKTDARSSCGIDRQFKVVLFVGNLVAVKALDVLIEAYATIARSYPTSICCIVGDGPLRTALQHQVRRCGISDRVRFVGSQPHDRLPSWFRAADVFVLPSHSEGVPNVLLEACACGTPFVATRVGGISEIAEFGEGTLVSPGDRAALAVAIGDILSAPPTRANTTRGFRSHDDAAKQVIHFLHEVVARSRRTSPARVEATHTLSSNVAIAGRA